MKRDMFKIRTLAVIFAVLLLLSGCRTEVVGNNNGANQDTCNHADVNQDELCDYCNIDVTVMLDFYGFNDLHGVFADSDTTHGVDETTTYLKSKLNDSAAYEIFISSGDMWQGSIESNSNRGALMTEWMNEVGFVSMTLGNHEFDWGSEYIAENAKLADFPFLGINVTDRNAENPYCKPSTVVERGGVRIGIIGAVGNCLSSISGEFQDGLEFAVHDELTSLVKEEATRLRREEGCDLVVYSLHDGSSQSSSGIKNVSGKLSDDAGGVYYDTALSDGYVDLVFEGHTHKGYIIKDKYGIYHMQTGGNNSAISYAQIYYNLVSDSYEVKKTQLLSYTEFASQEIEDDPVVNALITKYFPDGDPYLDVIGENSKFRSSNELRTLLADLYLKAGKKLWGSDYDIVLGGGFMSCRGSGLNPGSVTFDELYRLFPFDNDLVLGAISGEKLLSQFINSQNSNYFCSYQSDLASGIQKDKTYYIITDTYSSTYAKNRITEVARIKGTYARDLLREYIADGNMSTSTPIAIVEANEIGNALSDNQTTTEVYQVSGKISVIENTTWGNLYIEDDTGNTLYLYGLYDSNGINRYDVMDPKPLTGDTITVTGSITKYVSGSMVMIEIKNARLLNVD